MSATVGFYTRSECNKYAIVKKVVIIVDYRNALLGICVLGLAGRRSVFILWLSFYNETWESICSCELA